MESFIDKVATEILRKNDHDLGELCIVLPTRRAGGVLKRSLATKISKAAFAPDIITIADLIASESEQKIADKHTLLSKPLSGVFQVL